MTMGRISSVCRIASTSCIFSRTAAVFLQLLLTCLVCSAEMVAGVVYAHSSGASAHGSGVVTLAIGKNKRDFYYSKPLTEEFHDRRCFDLGAIWTVEVDASDDMLRAECSGTEIGRAHV